VEKASNNILYSAGAIETTRRRLVFSAIISNRRVSQSIAEHAKLNASPWRKPASLHKANSTHHSRDKHATRKVVAYTINHVNCLVDGNTVFTGDPNESTGTFINYVEDLFVEAGYTTDVNTPDSLRYHKWDGDIHCGTNVIRVIPGDKWWE